MTPTTPCSIPAEITAGDTVSWQQAGGDYPASAGWALAYTLVSSTKVLQVSATADGDDYAVTVDAATTAAWDAGSYRVQAYVTKGTDRHTIGTGLVRVLPNLAAATGGLDTRTHAQKVLDAINGWLESQAPVYGAMEINGRKISYYPLADLLKLRDRYQLAVNTEQRLAGGGLGGNRILAVL
jgi:hypothetical protein